MKLNIPNLEENKTLSPFTTYQIGGPADFFVEVHAVSELTHALSEARRNTIPLFLLGCGANILVTDKGFRGLVVRNRADRITFIDNDRVVAESGATISGLLDQCRSRGLSGFEHFVDIPSTVGGAMWQNLHFLTPDRERMTYIEEIVCASRILTQEGASSAVGVDYFQFGYDRSILQERKDIVLDVTFQLKRKQKDEITSVMDANRAWRRERQPQLPEYPSCGSVFRKIDGIGAGRLIEKAGLKGVRVGGAEISRKHANFIINADNARASDILELIQYVQDVVKRKSGYVLETEITVIGER
ncbi:MAG: UDP-N-acetylmuramate dehydrogenase [Candidatus Brocadiaceae bacterium]|nr:UDP-N-acetylmuramate dehydrogenase [Candidatus Brocadiaceae bacterium]